MNKLFATTAVLLLSSISHADIIKCNFTEPFVTTTYSTTQSTLTYDDASTGKSVIQNVSFQIKGPGAFELVNSKGQVLQTLTLNNQGSDGMSNNLYPYEVRDNKISRFANGGVGGCSSNHLKTKFSDENY